MQRALRVLQTYDLRAVASAIWSTFWQDKRLYVCPIPAHAMFLRTFRPCWLVQAIR